MSAPANGSRLACVRWFDSSITTGHVIAGERPAGVQENEAAGLVARTTPDLIALALRRTTTGWADVIKIPLVNVRRVRLFRTVHRSQGSPTVPKRTRRPPAPSGSEVAYVRWFDASLTTGATCGPDDACGLLELESVGLVVRETSDSITLALDRCIGTGGLRCTLCIPLVNVRSVERFRARR